MRNTYFYMAFWALAFGISGCGDITCKPGESYCDDSKTRMVCTPNGELDFENCSAGCDFNTGKCKNTTDSGSVRCQDNTYKCDIVAEQAVSQKCSGGTWINVACDNGCDATTGRCKDDENQPGTSTCTHGEYQCDANVSYVCLNGKWSIVDTCAYGCDADTGKCEVGNASPPSVECTTGSYKCDDNISYRCTDYGWEYDYCPYECDKKTGKCTELCEPGGTIYCQKTCNPSRSEGYYYAGGTVHTLECINYDCTTENDRVECKGGNLPDDLPSSCTKNVSPAICSDDKSVAYFCGDDGTYYKGETCSNYDCVVCPDGYGGCGITCKDNNSCYPTAESEYDCYDGIDNDCDGWTDNNDHDCLQPCPMMEGIPCERCLNVCDWLDGYYCDTRVGIMVKKTCANSCTVSGNRIECN